MGSDIVRPNMQNKKISLNFIQPQLDATRFNIELWLRRFEKIDFKIYRNDEVITSIDSSKQIFFNFLNISGVFLMNKF